MFRHDTTLRAPYDDRRKHLAFTVTSAAGGAGVYFPEHEWSFSGGVRLRAARSGR